MWISRAFKGTFGGSEIVVIVIPSLISHVNETVSLAIPFFIY